MSNTLVALKGLPGSGKTHFLKTKGLDVYTVSPDQIRYLIAAPQQNEDGEYRVYNSFEKQVEKMVFEIVEKRLQRGELTIIDATNTKLTYWNKYKQLAEKYKSELICLDFSHIDLETAKKQNKMRPEFKQVEDFVIEKFHEQMKIFQFPTDIKVIKPEEWDKKFIWNIRDLSNYKKVHHFGDIHGCFEPLNEFLKDGLKDDEFYIFVGDYVDRGIQNAEVLNFMFTIMNRENVVFLEGNHEVHLRNWSNNAPAKSKEFQRHTKTELEQKNVSRKLARYFCKKLEKAIYYQYKGKKVLVTHGGIVKVPDNLLTLSSEQMIRGVGNYNTNVDQLFTEKNKGEIYQIHGHRNTFELPIEASKKSFNLEGSIERGGHLRILTLSEDGFSPIEIKNNTVSSRFEEFEVKEFNNQDLIISLRENQYIKEEVQKSYPNISSFNFKRKVFTKGLWNKQTIKARGLFVNTKSTEIVSRSYNKFFNVTEREETTLEKLKESLKFPITLYLKENGFLGILGYDSYYKNLIYSTKNFIFSKHADIFRENYFNKVSLEKEEETMRVLRDENLTFTFEVVDPMNDPHIIEYKEPKLVLLDAIYREEEFRKLPYNELLNLGKRLGYETKQSSFVFNNWEEFEEWYNKASKDFELKEEGYVLEDSQGYMTKIKLPYYRFWKWMRTQIEKIETGNEPAIEAKKHPLGGEFINWYLNLENKLPSNDIITLRNMFYKTKK